MANKPGRPTKGQTLTPRTLRSRLLEPSKTDQHSDVVALFERAGRAPEELSDADAIDLMSRLRLPLDRFPNVIAVLRQDSWRGARYPIAYVKMAVGHEAKRDLELKEPMGLLVPSQIDGEPMNYHKYLDFLEACEIGPKKRKTGVWRDASHCDDGGDVDYIGMVPGEFLRSFTPEICAEFAETCPGLELDPNDRLDLDSIAKAAGLDSEESEVLFFKAHGYSRDEAMRQSADGEDNAADADKERKRIQAAWRRFDRNHCLKRITDVLRRRIAT
jgi:hypothetical protein